MKFFKWKIFIITSIVCLVPVLFGILLWSNLPDTMAVHFNFYGEADGFASKSFVVFGLPLMMVALQAFCCIISDINAKKFGDSAKLETVTKWIIPFLTVALQIITLGYSLGWSIDIRKSVTLIVGIMFIVLGVNLPKYDRVKNFKVDSEKARKINKFVGYGMVVMGVLFLISIFLPPVFLVACLLLLVPHTIITIIYSIKVAGN